MPYIGEAYSNRLGKYFRFNERYCSGIGKTGETKGIDNLSILLPDIRYTVVYCSLASCFSDKITDVIQKGDIIQVVYVIKDGIQREYLEVIENTDNKLFVNLYINKKVFLEDFEREGIKILSIMTKELIQKIEYEV